MSKFSLGLCLAAAALLHGYAAATSHDAPAPGMAATAAAQPLAATSMETSASAAEAMGSSAGAIVADTQAITAPEETRAPAVAETSAAGESQANSGEAAATEHRLLVMLRLPAPHFRPDASYGGRYIDDSGRSARRRGAEELAHAHGLTLVDDWPMPVLGLDCYVMQYTPGTPVEQIIAVLARDPRVEWAQPVSQFHGMGGADSSDGLYPVQPSAKYWHVAELHRVATGRHVNVAVVDSGVDGRHPDLAGQISVSENFVDAGGNPAEAHGTAVAGIIGARAGNGGIVGVAPEARLMALRACWQQPDLATRCNSFTLSKAINFAILHGANVINLSLSGPSDRLLDKLLDVALERGINVVGAIDPQANGAAFPASHPGVLAVASQPARADAQPPVANHSMSPLPLSGSTAITQQLPSSGNATITQRVPSSSPSAMTQRLPAGAMYAPGNDIPTSAPGARWSFVSGSSYAAAHVSGMVALLSELQPHTSPAQMQRLLLPNDTLNTGTIDACAIITRLTRSCSCSCVASSLSKHGSSP